MPASYLKTPYSLMKKILVIEDNHEIAENIQEILELSGYDVLMAKNGKEGTDVLVKMTLTAPGCGMGPVIAADAQARIMSLPEINNAEVELVWDPAWNQDMISEEGKMKLGMM